MQSQYSSGQEKKGKKIICEKKNHGWTLKLSRYRVYLKSEVQCSSDTAPLTKCARSMKVKYTEARGLDFSLIF